MTVVSRRKFLKLGLSASVGLAVGGKSHSGTVGSEDIWSFGVVADLHYADKAARNNRYYRESLNKLRSCVDTFNERHISFTIVLGDLVDAAPDRKAEQETFAVVTETLSELNGNVHVVLGNHDLAKSSKTEVLKHCQADGPKSYYSFDEGDFHFILLDGNFRSDGEPYDSGNFTWQDSYIPRGQIEWLKRDLALVTKPTIVLVHQNLHDESSRYGVKNADEVRSILETFNQVKTVFQGHDHKGGHRTINGIHYVTLQALVDGSGLENNAFIQVAIAGNQLVRIRGFGKQQDIYLF